jgi:tyrosyl-tRNA synthetase
MAGPDVAESVRILRGGTVDCITEDELRDKLASGRPLRVKLGLDPTASDIHLGSAVVLRKLRQFQDLGHVAVLIIGDFTARVGDPSGRTATRPALSGEEIDAHATTYVEQAKRILLPDKERLEVRYNSEWLAAMDMADVLRLTSRVTVARLLERNDFSARYEAGEPISLMELLYPLLQGWDSVMIDADVELGGTDQLFNLLTGREVMAAYGLEPQVALTVAYLDSWDGTGMSASRGNYIGLKEPPEEQFGKTMRIPDSLLEQWYRLVMEVDGAADGDPMAAKLALARHIVRRAWGEEAAVEAEEHFTRVVREGREPEDIEERPLPTGDPVHLPSLLADVFGLSTSEGRRMIAQGGVRVDGAPVAELDLPRERLAGAVVQAGKRRFVRLVPPDTTA